MKVCILRHIILQMNSATEPVRHHDYPHSSWQSNRESMSLILHWVNQGPGDSFIGLVSCLAYLLAHALIKAEGIPWIYFEGFYLVNKYLKVPGTIYLKQLNTCNGPVIIIKTGTIAIPPLRWGNTRFSKARLLVTGRVLSKQAAEQIFNLFRALG